MRGFVFHRRRGFSLVELVVTLAIIGLLTVTILPTLSRYGRNNNVLQAAQLLREDLAEARSNSISPDVTACPLLVAAAPLTYPINNYSIQLSPAPSTTDPYDSTNLAAPYQCGISASPLALLPSQVAILARSILYNPDGSVKSVFVDGIVRIDNLTSPAVVSVPIVGAIVKSTVIGFNSPSGSFFTNLVNTPCVNVANPIDYIPCTADVITVPSGQATTLALGNKQYAVIGLSDSNGYNTAVFVNLTSGQVTSNTILPQGFQ